jgi:peptidoglycan L-alanyl-D-glutamate endopeptidase CwlK
MLISNIKKIICITALSLLSLSSLQVHADLMSDLKRLKNAYPDYIRDITPKNIMLKNGYQIPIYGVEADNDSSLQTDDWGRVRYEGFFRQMYGNSAKEVEKNLTIVYWMPHIFGKRYPLQVTTVNHVDKQLAAVSAELEKLPPSYRKYLTDPQGTFCWRKIANTNRLSTHSFGTTIDINRKYSNYWQWDLERAGRRVHENVHLTYHNRIPDKIVQAFEKHGFVWGGDWYHYDTMHFEYRPEMAVG